MMLVQKHTEPDESFVIQGWRPEEGPPTRIRYNRDKLRYPSDLIDAEWSLLELLIPPAKRGGNKRRVNFREIVNGIMYVLSTGCQWRAIPKDLPPRCTVFAHLDLWTYVGTLDRMHHALYEAYREQACRDASPTACFIDGQSVKSAEKRVACIDPPGFDAGKLIKGKKRILSTPMDCCCIPSCMPPTFKIATQAFFRRDTLFGLFPFLKKLFADSAYQGPIFHKAVGKILKGGEGRQDDIAGR